MAVSPGRAWEVGQMAEREWTGQGSSVPRGQGLLLRHPGGEPVDLGEDHLWRGLRGLEAYFELAWRQVEEIGRIL